MAAGPTLTEWAIANLRIGGLSFGGSGRALMYQDLVVRERGWLTDDEFYETLTLAQALPGPNIVNLVAYLGVRFAGIPGAIVGVLGLCLPGSLLAALLFTVVPFEHPALRDLFQGFALGSAVLFLVFVGRMARGLAAAPPIRPQGLDDPLLWRLGVAALVALASALGTPLPWLIGGGVAVSLLVEFFVETRA
ncbi:MAG TPA: chromate transporter [Thermodesulfobacteriota bacterium]